MGMKFLLFLLSIQVSYFLAIACITGEVRLVNGTTANQGRVEICVNRVWGTVCDDSWTTNNAKVICRQLGYSTDGARYFIGPLHSYGSGSGSIFLDNVYCFGNECNLLACSYLFGYYHNCDHTEDVGVSCSSLRASYPSCEPLPSSTCDCSYQSSINVSTLIVTTAATVVKSTASNVIDTSITTPIITVTTTVGVQSVVDNSKVSMMCLSDLSYQSIITMTVTSTATAEGCTAAITSAIVLPLLLLIIIVSLLSSLAFIYCYKKRKALNKKPVCDRKMSTLKEIEDEDADGEIVFNISYNDQSGSFHSASLQLPPLPEDLLSDGFYSEIKDCYL